MSSSVGEDLRAKYGPGGSHERPRDWRRGAAGRHEHAYLRRPSGLLCLSCGQAISPELEAALEAGRKARMAAGFGGMDSRERLT